MTGNDLIKIAFDLLALTSVDGTFPSDTEDLKARSVSLINIVISENAELDGRIRKTEHSVNLITSLDDVIDCSEIVAQSVLPYGLARLLIVGEDDALASSFAFLYNEAKQKAIRFGKAKTHPIEEAYR